MQLLFGSSGRTGVRKQIFLALLFVVLSVGSQAQQVGEKGIPPVPFVRVAPKDVEIDPWQSTAPNPKFRGEITYDDEAVDRTNTYDGHHPSKSHILIRSIGGDSSNNTLTAYFDNRKYDAPYVPQFSSDGRFVLFKFGGIATDFPFEMYVLDVKSGVVKRVDDPQGNPYLPVFQELRWSPDSNYIAWVDGLGSGGDRLDNARPGTLRVCNWRTGQSRVVATADEVRYSFSWSAPHTLLWSQLPPHPTLLPAPQTSSSPQKEEPGRLPSIEDEPLVKEHPTLFEVNADDATAKPRKVLLDAFAAQVSSSGKQLAFFGSYDISKPYPLRFTWDRVSGSAMYLSVANRDGSQRQALNIQHGGYPQLSWQHDDRHLLSLEIKHTAAYDIYTLNKPHSFDITLRQFDVATHKVRILAESLPGGDSDHLLSISADDQTLYLLVGEPLDEINNSIFSGAYRVGNSIIAVDLKTGKQTLIARTINALGLDWHEDNLASTSLSKSKVAPLSASGAALKKCPLHGTALQTENVRISYGLPGFKVGYLATQKRLFPDASSRVLGGCIVSKDSPTMQTVKFCPKCRAAEKRWLAAHRGTGFVR